MTLSVFELYRVGIGPSSSHTVGPMRAARMFAEELGRSGHLQEAERIGIELYGSLAATGAGHGCHDALRLGLEGEHPESIDPLAVSARAARIRSEGIVRVLSTCEVRMDSDDDLMEHANLSLPLHSNGMLFRATAGDGSSVLETVYYSVGGGSVCDRSGRLLTEGEDRRSPPPHPFDTADVLLRICARERLRVSDVMLANESAWRPAAQTTKRLLAIWYVMRDCVARGCRAGGDLPGGLGRRASRLYAGWVQREAHSGHGAQPDLEWVNICAMAVAEENASGGRVVTAPTNGAAGVIPAVVHHCLRVAPGADTDIIVRFLLTAGAIGALYKERASISAAEVGCQGEIGVACSMAAAALAEPLGASPEQVENAAEIGMEHNLGLTCDLIGGLVQVPCIERNAMGAVKAINAALLALSHSGSHSVSLDSVIQTMLATGRDMSSKYKETAGGGLAAHAACQTYSDVREAD